MTNRLLALRAHLAPLLASIDPAETVRLPLHEAENRVAAEDVVARSAFPPAGLALRSGFAVRALDCAGASPQSPAPLPLKPVRVSAGEPLPPDCDAILDPTALHVGRFGPEALEAVEPGAWVRLAGQDLAAGETIVVAGRRITPEALLAASIAGIDSLAVRAPLVRLEWRDGPERDWLVRRIVATGARLAQAEVDAHLLIHSAADEGPRLALKPGETSWAESRDATVALALPARFDALLGAWCALALPILAHLSGAQMRAAPALLARKIASAVGWTEVALLRVEGGEADPLAVGDGSLGAIARADAFAILDPGSEGAPAGASIPAIWLDRPF